MMPQFKSITKHIDWEQLYKGLLLFLLGLAKKVIIADYLAAIVRDGYAETAGLQLLTAWQASLAYTLQIYFDFSGYADMAVGLGLMFGIVLPFNFNSPYQALSIRDFWRRWHITLSRWLRDYVYFPLGGSRVSTKRVYMNVLAVAFISGLWHGAGLTFVLWGLCHGLALAVCRFWEVQNYKLPRWLAWLLTFLFVHLTWVLFRAENLTQAADIYTALFFANGIESNINSWVNNNALTLSIIVVSLLIATRFKNSQTLVGVNSKGLLNLNHRYVALYPVLLFIACFFALAYVPYSEFIYFNF